MPLLMLAHLHVVLACWGVLYWIGRALDSGGPPSMIMSAFACQATCSPSTRPDSGCFSDGCTCVDTFTPIGRGQRVGLFAGSGVGKSTLLGMLARGGDADVNVVALIGERGREVREFIENSLSQRHCRKPYWSSQLQMSWRWFACGLRIWRPALLKVFGMRGRMFYS